MDSFNLILSAIPILIGLVVIGLVLGVAMKAKSAAKKWLTVPGNILSAELEMQSSRSAGGSPSQYLKPVVTYSYQVGGQSYTSKRLDFSSRAYLSEEKANRRMAAYQPGSKTTVYYDPADPTKAVLEPAASGNTLVIILGMALILVGVLFAI